MKSPVLFIIFIREDTTRRVFEQIRKAKPPRLYIAADGPRPDRPDDIEKCKATRSVVNDVDWDCEVKTLFREKNLGCGKGVSSAITWFFENEEQGIIIEDDILPNPEFFIYCDEMLEHYKNSEKIQLIAGYNFFFDGYSSPYSYYMSRFLQIWGWASWRRVWQTYTFDTKQLDRREYLNRLKEQYSKPVCRYYKRYFDIMSTNKVDTWDYQFFFNMVLFGRYSIIPYSNLIENIGFGTLEASHATDSKNDFIKKLINHHSHPIYPIIHPDGDYLDSEADKTYAKMAQIEMHSIIYRAIRKVVRMVRGYK